MVKPGTVCLAGGESKAGGHAHIHLKERVAGDFEVFWINQLMYGTSDFHILGTTISKDRSLGLFSLFQSFGGRMPLYLHLFFFIQ
jgi:hypothetical protein